MGTITDNIRTFEMLARLREEERELRAARRAALGMDLADGRGHHRLLGSLLSRLLRGSEPQPVEQPEEEAPALGRPALG